MKKVYGVLSAGFLFCNFLSAQDLQSVTQNGNTTDRQIVVHRTDGSYGINASNSSDADLLLGTSPLGASVKYAWMQSSFPGRHLVLNPDNGGYIGIGINEPTSKLDVNGDMQIRPSTTAWGEGLTFTMPITQKWGGIRWRRGKTNYDGNWAIGYTGLDATDDLVFAANNGGVQLDNILRLTKNGNVGIGTAAPQSTLAVKGTITAQKIVITQSGWADYVFDSSYQLKSLSQVETYIRKNKHLPEVPSTAEVKKEGVDLVDNQVLLLKKIEELTLYIIQQNNEMKAMKDRIKSLEAGR